MGKEQGADVGDRPPHRSQLSGNVSVVAGHAGVDDRHLAGVLEQVGVDDALVTDAVDPWRNLHSTMLPSVVDLTDDLRAGDNTVTVRVASSLNNRLLARGYYERVPDIITQIVTNEPPDANHPRAPPWPPRSRATPPESRQAVTTPPTNGRGILMRGCPGRRGISAVV
jgi:hypothetical protein